MINFTRFGLSWSIVLIFGFILSFHSFQVANAQEKGKFNLGPQLIPMEVKTTGHFSYNPWPQALVSNCANSDFSEGDWTNWQGCYGTFSMEGWPQKPTLRPCITQGFATNQRRHVIEAAPGYQDPYSCNSINTVFPGEAFSARLGDTSGGGNAEQLKYDVTISQDNYLFIYRYAVVLESPNHPTSEQPGFTIQVQDLNGNLVDSCGFFSFTAPTCTNPPNCPNVEGWNYCPSAGYVGCYSKNWTTIGMDLSAYASLGTVRIVFTTRGCSHQQHRGYAYISAYCNAITIQTSLCEGQDSAILTAPPGFKHYAWSNGDTTQSITVPAVEGATIQCTLTAVNECTVTILNTLHYTQIHTGFIQTLNCAQRPSSFEDTTWVSQNQVTAWRWFFGDPASGASDSSNLQNPTHSFTAAGNYDVTLISYSTDGCSDTVMNQISIDSLPDVSNTSRYKIICSHDSTDITLTSNVSAVLFTWTATSTSPLITGYSNQTTPVSYLNQHLTNNGNAIDSVIYAVVPHNATCAGDDTNFYVAVYPHPNLTNAVRVKSICDSTFTNVILESNVDSTRFTWICTTNSPNVFGYSDNTTTPDTLINQRLWNTGFNIDTVYYHVVPHAYGCLGDTTVYKVAVYPVPDLSNAQLSKTICDSTLTGITLTSHVSGTTFTWTCTPSSANITGWSNNNIGTTTLNQRLDNTGPNIESVTYHIVPKANGCNGHTTNFIVTVNPTPHLANPVPAPICSASPFNVTLISDVAGAGFTWTASCNPVGSVTGFTNPQLTNVTVIADVLTNITNNFATVTYHITSHANGCNGPVRDFTVQVNPTPHLTNAVPLPICSATLFNVTLVPDVAGGNFTWTASCNPVGSVTGFTNPQVTNVTAISDILTNTTSNVATVTYHITPHANGCDGPLTDYVVTVYPTPDLSNSPKNKQQCNNQATNITLTSNVTGTLFTWTCTPSSANVSGFTNSTNPTTLINQTLVNSGFNTETVTYHITPHANNCDGVVTDYVVTVYPTPDLSNNPKNKQQCNNVATNITLTSNIAGTLFTWTCTPSSVNLSGFYNNGIPSGLLDQTLVNSGFTTETVTYHITPHANGCSGNVADYVVTVYPTADAYFQPAAQAICTGQMTNIDILSHVDGTTFSWTASASSPLVIGYLGGIGTNISQTIFSSSTLVETVTYLITPVANVCTGAPSSVIVTVNPGPALTTFPLAQTICSAHPITISLTSNVAGAAFNWTATGSSFLVTGFSSGSGNQIQQTLINTGFSIETVTYAITPSANGCTGAPINYIVTVNPVPDLSNSPKSQQQCNNQSTNLTLTSNVAGTLFTWTCTPSSGNITGWSNSVAPGTIINQTLVNASLSPETVTYHLTPHANGCDGPVTDYVVTVIFKPALTNSPLNKAICNNTSTNITLTANVSGSLFTWLAIGGSPSVTGYSDNTTNPTVTLNQTLINSSNLPQTVTYRIVPHAIGCEGDTTNFVVTVQPTPNLTTLPLDKQQCNNLATNITLTSNVAGTLFTWTCTPSSANVSGFTNSTNPTTLINQTLVNSGYNIETVTYHITPKAYNCDGPILNYVVTVYPTPDIYFQPLSQTLCDGQQTNIQNLSHVAVTTFSWTASSSSLLVTGYAAGNGNLIQQTLLNSGTTVETVTYVTTPVANGCTGPSQSVTVTVNPTPHLTTTPLIQTICTASSISVNLTSTVIGSIYAWTCTASSPNLSGFSGGNGNLISQTLSNSGYTIETVTYHITPTANGCSGPVANYVVTVNPKPDVSNNPLSSQICSGTSPNINLTSNVSGTNFSWTATGSSPNITGYGPGSGTVINQILINLGLNTESVTYHITPFANGCNGDLTDYLVTIVSIPDVYFQPPAQTVCSQQSSNIQNLSHVVGTIFTWTVTASSLNVTGYAAGSGNLIQQTLFNSGTTIETVTYAVSPAAFGCPPGIPQNVVVTVNPKPAITNSARNSSICSGSSTAIIPQSSVTGSTYTWTASGSSILVTGFSAGSGLQIQQTLTNTGYNIETVTYVVTPIANSCSGDTAHFRVTVYPVADVYFTPPLQALCPLQTSNININSNVAGTSFTWTATGSSLMVTGYSGGSGSLIQQTLNNAGYNIETVTYHVSPTANSCAGTNNNVIVTVNPNPTVTFTPCWDIITTTNAQPITLKGGIPLNGSYSGTGVSAGIFFPAVAGIGTFNITYSYSNLYRCSGTASQAITVIAPLSFNCGNNFTDIRDNKSYPTVLIGTQCWMAANLNYGSSLAGTLTQRDNCTPEKFCYNDIPANCTSAGGLYQWDEIMQYSNVPASQGLCPPEWHIPIENEWNTLFNFYISNGFAGSPLKSDGYSGFNAYFDGAMFKNVNWNFLNFATIFWSSNSRGNNKAWAHGMNEYNPSVSFYPSSRSNAFSVRCLKD